jgi:hypothetical protein
MARCKLHLRLAAKAPLFAALVRMLQGASSFTGAHAIARASVAMLHDEEEAATASSLRISLRGAPIIDNTCSAAVGKISARAQYARAHDMQHSFMICEE